MIPSRGPELSSIFKRCIICSFVLSSSVGVARGRSPRLSRLPNQEDFYFMLPIIIPWVLLLLYKFVSPYCPGKYSPLDPSVSFCPMCGCESVSDEEKLAHRKMCSQKYRGEMEQIQIPIRDLKCLHCRGPMRLWPMHKGESFKCSNDLRCWAALGTRFQNRGDNWFMCFGCDYSCCSDCVEKKLKITANDNISAGGFLPFMH